MEKIIGRPLVIIFEDSKSGFKIMKIKGEEEWTVSGYFPTFSSEASYIFYGSFFVHPKYGKQFKAQSYEREEIDSYQGLLAFLSSDLFTGIGPKTADKLIQALGMDLVKKVMEDKSILKGILSSNKIEMFYQELISNMALEKTMIDLFQLGISSKFALKLFQKYGNQALAHVKENPYQLIYEIDSIGFKRADAIALSVGFKKDDSLRINAAINYVMGLITKNYGYTYVLKEQLIETSSDFLHLDQKLILDHLSLSGLMIEGNHVFLKNIYKAEIDLASKVKMLASNESIIYDEKVMENELSIIEMDMGIEFTLQQKETIFEVLKSPMSLVTGGPGTGKTTLINGILRLYLRLHRIEVDDPKNQIGLMAPTGRAAKRIFEATRFKSGTIHHHLGYNYEGEFEYGEENLLPYELVIIDECSMVDVLLANQLFKALKTHTQVVMVGDLDQLPSVGPGMVLKDLFRSKIMPVFSLNEIHRQSNDSNIIELSRWVREGRCSWDILSYHDDLSFYRVKGNMVTKEVVSLYKELMEAGYDPLKDIQVLSPMYKGEGGIDELNEEIQKAINPNSPIAIKGKEYRKNDKILELQNTPDLGIMNGDIGIIQDIFNGTEVIVEASFDGKWVKLNQQAMDSISHAYAISVHKSQGSEYKIVILVVSRGQEIMLKRKLLYTAITRAKEKLFVIGDLDSFKNGINSQDPDRQTSLLSRLTEMNRILIDIPGCPFTFLGEEGMEKITPYDFMENAKNKLG